MPRRNRAKHRRRPRVMENGKPYGKGRRQRPRELRRWAERDRLDEAA